MPKPMMERRHFDLIVRVVRDMPLIGCGPVEIDRTTLEKVRLQIARRFANDLTHINPNFNRARFLEACGVKES